MGEGGDSLHLDGVALVKRVVQDAGRINYLPPSVLILAMTDEQVLGCKGIRLHIYVRVCHIVYERGLADIGEAGHDQCARVGVYLGQTRQMLPHFF